MSEKLPLFTSFKPLRECIVSCRKCPRLVYFRESVPPKKAYEDAPHWRKPIPGFGDPAAWLLLVGLAPSIQGGNRTGRIFTGDESARFLIDSLHKEEFASQPASLSVDDGLQLKGCYLTAAVKCVPPDNKPTPKERSNCSSYFWNELYLLKNVTAILALGKFAFDAYLHLAKEMGFTLPRHPFKHGGKYLFEGLPTLYASYHPSPQNTNTGKLTQAMFRNLLQKIRKEQEPINL